MTRTMQDAVNPENLIPDECDLIAGYVNGVYTGGEYDRMVNRWPGKPSVRIDVLGTDPTCHVVDVEAGDATPEQAAHWTAAKWARGETPTVYTSTTMVAAVYAACDALGVPRPNIWEANYTVPPMDLNGPRIAHQYTDLGPRDLSVVADYWPGVDPAPTPKDEPGMNEWALIQCNQTETFPGGIALIIDGKWAAVAAADDAGALENNGVKLTTVSEGTYRNIYKSLTGADL